MIEGCQQWEGQRVDGKFLLQQYLGGSDHGAVFLTERESREPQKAAIKLIPARSTNAEIQLSRWGTVAGWLHPHLIRLYESGRCRLGDTDLLYVVMEYAEENLSQVVPERRLTSTETRDVLLPVLDALGYVHGKGFIHGHLKPSNILAVADRVKISSDALYKTGEPAGKLEKPGAYNSPEITTEPFAPATDVWSVGALLTELLTQRLPVSPSGDQTQPRVPEILPAPYLEIARHCLRTPSQARWTLAEIAAALRPAEQPGGGRDARPPVRVASKRVPFNWRYALAIAIAALALTGLVTIPKLFDSKALVAIPSPVRTPTVAPTPPAPEPEAKPAKPVAGKQGRFPKKGAAGTGLPSSVSRPLDAADRMALSDSGNQGAVVHQVAPNVPDSALDTVQGTIKVRVRVSVDPAGNVTDAALETQGNSPYFARKSMEAAKGWKFTAGGENVARQGLLRFEFSSDSVQAFLESFKAGAAKPNQP